MRGGFVFVFGNGVGTRRADDEPLMPVIRTATVRGISPVEPSSTVAVREKVDDGNAEDNITKKCFRKA